MVTGGRIDIFLARRMAMSVKTIGRRYGRLVAGGNAYEREPLDAWDAIPRPHGRYLDSDGVRDAA
jgi:hypothetical protein